MTTITPKLSSASIVFNSYSAPLYNFRRLHIIHFYCIYAHAFTRINTNNKEEHRLKNLENQSIFFQISGRYLSFTLILSGINVECGSNLLREDKIKLTYQRRWDRCLTSTTWSDWESRRDSVRDLDDVF